MNDGALKSAQDRSGCPEPVKGVEDGILKSMGDLTLGNPRGEVNGGWDRRPLSISTDGAWIDAGSSGGGR